MVKWLLVCWFAPVVLLAQPTLRVDTAFTESSLGGHLTRLDSPAPLDPVRLSTLADRFRAVTEPVVNYGTDAGHHYLRFRMQNTGPQARRLLLTLGQLFFDEADLFVYQADTLLSVQRMNWQMPVLARPRPYRYPQFLIGPGPGQTLTVVLHTRVSPRQRSSKALLQLSDERTFARQDTNDALLLGGLLGCCGLMLGFGLVFWAFTRQLIYGLYCGYVLTRIGYILNVNGLAGQLLDQPGPLADPVTGYALLTVSTVLFGECYLRFVQFRQYSPRWLRLALHGLGLTLIGLVVLLLVWPTAGWLRQVATVAGLVYLPGLILALGLAWRHRRGQVLLFGLAAGPILLLLVYYLLASSGALPIYNYLFMSGFVPVLVVEMVGLGAGLAWQFEQDRRRAIEERNEARRDTARRVMQAQEDERAQLAADLHDDLGGTLAALQTELSIRHERQPDGPLQTALSLTDRASRDLRLIAHHLMPSAFAEKGLHEVLEETADLADRQGRARVVFVSTGAVRRLPPDVEINVYRIVREWLTNALRHARARQIVIQLIFHPDSLYASVEDDGVGLPPVLPGEARPGLGLPNTALRIRYLSATFTSETGPTGTLMALDVPHRSDPDRTPPADDPAGR